MRNRLRFALLLMGFTSLIVQVLLIREFLICFYGNELTIGLILGNWIILEAIGSSISSQPSQKSKRPLLFYCVLQCLIALYLPCAVYLVRIIKDFLPLVTGEGVSIIPILISSFFILAPLSIFDGAQFPFGCRIWKDYTKKPIESTGSVYIFEAVGFIIAGPIFTYLFITKLHSFQIAFSVGLINLLSCFLLLQNESRFTLRKIITTIVVILIGVNIFVLLSSTSNYINKYSLKKQWGKYDLIDSKNSIYGNLAVTKEKEQYTFFSDGMPIITAPIPDIVLTEEFIHFAMLCHPNPKKILIVGGGAGGPISEILKYPVERVDYAELDPLLIEMVKKYPTRLTQEELDNPRLSIKISDGARYIKTTTNKYDVIFINLPTPTSLQLNRFYTKELFNLVKNIYKDNNGIFLFKLPGSLSYLNEELQQLNLSILDTLKETFQFVKVIPGDFNLYLSSKSDLNLKIKSIVERLKQRNISTLSLTPFHIEYRLHSRWREWFYSILNKTPKVKVNTLFSPTGVFYGLSYWNSLFSPSLNKMFKFIDKINLKLMVLPIALVFVLIFFFSLFYPKMKVINIPYAILTTGILGMSLDLIIIFIYQSIYGYVYHHIALLITAFMSGLTFGGWLITRRLSIIKNRRLNFIIFEIGLLIFSLTIIPIFIFIGNSQANLSFMFYIIIAISGFLVGSEFPLANSLYKQENSPQTAGMLYALDLLGSWIGALIVSIALIPILGLIQTCIFLAVLKLSSLILIGVSKN
ncbi:MAG: hypothetical protein ABIA97_01985 [Candidatus Omnitrophota bacterium]